jgi:mono/diheme cytochrome c family protein
MAGYWRAVILGGGLLCSLVVLSGQAGQVSHTMPKNHPASSVFVLPQKPKNELTPAEQKGQSLYEYYCVICHGKRGKGDGFNSYNLPNPPKNLADRAQMAVLSDSQIEKVIRKGGTTLGLSPQMPAWGGVLTEKEAADVTAFIRTLAMHDGGKK